MSHTTPDCYWPGGGKEGQFPPNFGQRTKANIANSTNSANSTTSTPEKVEHFALSAQILDTPGQSGIVIENNPSPHPHSALYLALISKGFQSFDKGKVLTFMDSAASDTMFVLKEAFKDYKPISNRMGDSAKVDNGGFEILGEGTVIQRYKVDGKEKEITYTRVLHTPTLNANLISVSALDKAGLLTTFGQGKGVAWKMDGTIVLAGKGVNGMYLLETVENKPTPPLMMAHIGALQCADCFHSQNRHTVLSRSDSR